MKFWNIRIAVWFFLFCSMFSFSSAYAAVDHFKVTLEPTSAKVWEAIDITIEALDKSEETVTDYVGTIIVFSETDKEADFPTEGTAGLQENTYEFKSADQGKIKFENAVKFKNQGKQSVQVYDLNDETILGVAEVNISAWATSSAEEISILSPETGLTIASNKVTVSGTTKKNHRVLIQVNGSEEVSTTSNSEWIFEQEITNLQDGEVTFKAMVLDADNVKVGESSIVNIKISSSKPKLQSIRVTPTGDVEAESEISIEVITNKGLESVKAIIDDVVTTLQEGKDGVYLGKTRAPKTEGTYKVDVSLKNDLGSESKELNVATLTVIPALNAPLPEDEVKTSSGVTLAAPGRDPLKITGLKLTELKTKSVLTWDKVANAMGYNIYKKTEDGKLELIQTVKDPSFTVNITGKEITHDYFYVRAYAKTNTGTTLSGSTDEEVYEWDISEATKIQTGPEKYILLALIALIATGFFFMFKRRKLS